MCCRYSINMLYSTKDAPASSLSNPLSIISFGLINPVREDFGRGFFKLFFFVRVVPRAFWNSGELYNYIQKTDKSDAFSKKKSASKDSKGFTFIFDNRGFTFTIFFNYLISTEFSNLFLFVSKKVRSKSKTLSYKFQQQSKSKTLFLKNSKSKTIVTKNNVKPLSKKKRVNGRTFWKMI